jgi:hypothetical protein
VVLFALGQTAHPIFPVDPADPFFAAAGTETALTHFGHAQFLNMDV